ncbi:MAG: hypothetical protein KFB93_06035 [Simkaniaceae bacterium]|nr:MAG: hypothetical protein KFB93_06035 [Simkaniaceae bacterium]
MENIVKIPFFHPIERTRNETSISRNILYALYDVVIDDMLSSPFTKTCYKVRKNQFRNRVTQYIVTSDHGDFRMGRLGYLISKVAILYGLIYYRKYTSVALVIGLALKYYVRSNEVYVLPNGRGERRHVPQISLEQRRENLHRWMQKWMCDSYFYLFAVGMTEASVFPEVPSEDVMIRVFIGEESAEYPQSVLIQLPFFRALMGSGMRDVSEEGLRLSEEFPFNHGDLGVLQQKLTSSDASEWGELDAFDFLCIGMREDCALHVKKLGAVQQAILNQSLEAMNPYLQHHSNKALERGPGVKVGAYSLNFLPSIERINQLDKIEDQGTRINATIDCIGYVLNSRDYNSAQRYFYCNKVIQDLIDFLHLKRDNQIDIIREIMNVLEKCPEAPNYITVLSLPCNVSFASHLLPQLLQKLPNLLWLQIDLFSQELTIESDFTESHAALRVLSISGQRINHIQRETLKDRFPNVDVMETD